MLVLTRKAGEKINIGSGITITVVEIRGAKVRLGIDAPEDVPIFRAELTNLLARIGAEPAAPASHQVERPLTSLQGADKKIDDGADSRL